MRPTLILAAALGVASLSVVRAQVVAPAPAPKPPPKAPSKEELNRKLDEQIKKLEKDLKELDKSIKEFDKGIKPMKKAPQKTSKAVLDSASRGSQQAAKVLDGGGVKSPAAVQVEEAPALPDPKKR